MFELYLIFNPNQTGLSDSSRTIVLEDNCPRIIAPWMIAPRVIAPRKTSSKDNYPRGKLPPG